MTFVSHISDQFGELIRGSLRNISGYFGQQLRYAYYRKQLKYMGTNVRIDAGVYILNPGYVSIADETWIDKNVILIGGPPHVGKRKILKKSNQAYNGNIGELHIGVGCHIAPNCVIQAHGGIRLGNYVGIAAGSKLYSLSHHYRNLNQDDNILYKFSPMAPEEEQFLIAGPIVMEDNAALGLNSVILPGVTIGKNSWVGVNSTVSHDVPPNSIASGSPAVVVKQRFQR